MLSNLNKYRIILASKSPRRKQLLSELGIDFEVRTLDVEELFPEDMAVVEIPAYLAELKAAPFKARLKPDELIITSDTIVSIDNLVLGKPDNKEEALAMLQQLSGRSHQVISGVSLLTINRQETFTATTDVFFKKLSDEEIIYYIDKFQPYDKAGAYGIQEWIGHAAVERIEGSYFNVMGLPVQHLYEVLKTF